MTSPHVRMAARAFRNRPLMALKCPSTLPKVQKYPILLKHSAWRRGTECFSYTDKNGSRFASDPVIISLVEESAYTVLYLQPCMSDEQIKPFLKKKLRLSMLSGTWSPIKILSRKNIFTIFNILTLKRSSSAKCCGTDWSEFYRKKIKIIVIHFVFPSS